VRYLGTELYNYAGNPTGLLLNDEATQIRVSNIWLANSPILFSFSERKLELNAAASSSLKPPVLKTTELDIAECCERKEPSLNGMKLKLEAYEGSYSVAVSPDKRTFLLGTQWYLRLFDWSGKQIWKRSVPVIPWAINTSKTGRVAVVTFVDGLTRWYRASDGEELLTLYVDQGKRWIAWTPSGYYDASPDAEDLIGWHVNNGRDAAADFFPNHLFRGYFFRPDVIDRILNTLDESVAVKLADQKAGRKEFSLSIAKILPPVIEMNSSKTKEISTSTLSVNYLIRSHTAEPVTRVNVFVDGKEATVVNSTGNRGAKGSDTITLQVPKRDSEVTLTAQNRFTTSLPVKIQLKWRSKGE
jgi:hypothetical protein